MIKLIDFMKTLPRPELNVGDKIVVLKNCELKQAIIEKKAPGPCYAYRVGDGILEMLWTRHGQWGVFPFNI